MDDLTLATMLARINRCRRLAEIASDQAIADELNRMADEGQADIDRMTAEQVQLKIEISPRTVK